MSEATTAIGPRYRRRPTRAVRGSPTSGCRTRARSGGPPTPGPRRRWSGGDGRLMIIACDHPARGANGVGDRPLAMGNRIHLLERLRDRAGPARVSTVCWPARTSSRTCCCSARWRARSCSGR